MSKNSPFTVDIGQGLSVAIGVPTIATWNTASRPKNAKAGTFGFNTQTSDLEYWNGTVWLKAHMSEN